MNNKRLNNESSSFSCRCISKSKHRRNNGEDNIPITKPYIPAEVYYDVESKTSKLTEPEDPSNFKNLLREVAVTTQSLYKAFSKAYHKSTKTLKDTSYSECQTITSTIKEVVGDSGCRHTPDQSPKHLFKSGKSSTRKHKCIYMEPVTIAVPVKLHVNSDNAENIICTEIILEAFGDPIYSNRKGKKRKIEPLEDYDEPIRTATVAACEGGIKCKGGIPQDFLECLKYQGEFKGPEIDDLHKSEKYLTSGKGQKFESKQECQTIFGFLKRQPSQQNTFREKLVLNKSLVTIGSDVYFSCASSEDIVQKPKTVSNNVFDMIKDQNSCPNNLPAHTMRSIASYSDEDYPHSQQLKCGLSKGTKKFEYPSKIKKSSVLTKPDSFEMDTGVAKTMEYPSKIKRSLIVTDPEAAKRMKISQIIQTEVPTNSAATSPHRTSYTTKERISQNTQTDPKESTLGRQMFPKISPQHKDAQKALPFIQMESHSSDLKEQGRDFQGNLLSDITSTKSPLPEKKIPEIYSDELKGLLDKPIGEKQVQRLSDPMVQRLSDPMMQKAKEEDVRKSVPKEFKVPPVAPIEIDDKIAEKVPTELSVNIPQEDLEKKKSIPKAPPVPPKPQLHEKPIIESYADEMKGLDEKPSRKEPIQKLSDTTFEKSEEKDKRGSLPKDFKAPLVPPLIGNETKEPLKQNDIIPTTAKATSLTESYAELLSRIPEKPKGGYLTDRVSDTVLHEPPAKELRTSLPDDFKQPLETSNVFDLQDKKIKPPEELKGNIISDEYHSAQDINLDNTTISKSQEKDVFEKKTPDTTTKVPLPAPLSDSYKELLKQLADKPSGGFLSERVSDTVLHEPPLKEFRTTLPEDFKLSEEGPRVKEVQNRKSTTEGEPRESVTSDEYHSFHELEELKNLADTSTNKPLSHKLSDTQLEREKTQYEERRSLPIKVAEGTQTDVVLDTGHQKRKSLRNDILDGLRSLADPVYATNNNNYTKDDEQIIKYDLCKILLPKKHKSEDLNDNVVEDLRYLFAYMSENKRQETPLSPSPTVGRTETLNDIRFILDPKAEIQPTHRFSKAEQEKLLELLTKLLKPPSDDTNEIDTVARKSIVNQIRELLYSHNKESENEESSENEIYYTPGQHTPIKRAAEQRTISSDEFFKNIKVTSSDHNVAPQIIITSPDNTMYASFISAYEQGYYLSPALKNVLDTMEGDQYPQHEDSEEYDGEYFDTYDDHQKKHNKERSRTSAQLSLPSIPEENIINAEKNQPPKPLKTSQDIQTDLFIKKIQEIVPVVERKTISEQTQTQESTEEIKPIIIAKTIQTEFPIAQIPPTQPQLSGETNTIETKPDEPTDSSKIKSNVKSSFEKRASNDQSKENELSETNSLLLLDEKFRKFSDSMKRSDRVYEYKPEEDFVPYRDEPNKNESPHSSESSVKRAAQQRTISSDEFFKNIKVTSSDHNVAPQVIITSPDNTMYASFISANEQGYYLSPALTNVLDKMEGDQYPQHEDSEEYDGEYFDTYDDHQKKHNKERSRTSAQLSLPSIPEENIINAEKNQPPKPLKTSQDIQTDLFMKQIQEIVPVVERKTISEQTQTQESTEEIKPIIILKTIQTEFPIAQIPPTQPQLSGETNTIETKPDEPTDSSKIKSNVKSSFEKRASNDQSKENELSKTNSLLLLDEKFRKFSDSMKRSDRVYEYKPEEDFVPYRDEPNKNESPHSSESSVKRAAEQRTISSDEFFKNIKVTSSDHNVAPQVIITSPDNKMYASFISANEQGYYLSPALTNVLDKMEGDQYPQHEDSEEYDGEYFDTYDDHQKKHNKERSRTSAQLSLPSIPEENIINAEKNQPPKSLKTSQDIQTDLFIKKIQEIVPVVERKTISEQTQTQESTEEIKPIIILKTIQTEFPIAQIPPTRPQLSGETNTIETKPDEPTDSSKIKSNVKSSFEKRASNDQSKKNELSETNSLLLLDEKFRKFSDSMKRSDRVYEYKPEEDFIPYRDEPNKNESPHSSESSVRKIRRIKRITKDDLKRQSPIEGKTQAGIKDKTDTKLKSTDQPLEQHPSETSIKKKSQFLPIQYGSTKRRDDKKGQEGETPQKEDIAPNTANPPRSKLHISSARIILRASKQLRINAKKNRETSRKRTSMINIVLSPTKLLNDQSKIYENQGTEQRTKNARGSVESLNKETANISQTSNTSMIISKADGSILIDYKPMQHIQSESQSEDEIDNKKQVKTPKKEDSENRT